MNVWHAVLVDAATGGAVLLGVSIVVVGVWMGWCETARLRRQHAYRQAQRQQRATDDEFAAIIRCHLGAEAERMWPDD